MELENYFDFLERDDIRIKGTRVGIETVLGDYLDGASPEEIAARYRTLTLEQIYATLTYYWHNQAQVDAYLTRLREYSDAAYNTNFSIRFLRLRGYSNYANNGGASRNGSAHETISIFD